MGRNTTRQEESAANTMASTAAGAPARSAQVDELPRPQSGRNDPQAPQRRCRRAELEEEKRTIMTIAQDAPTSTGGTFPPGHLFIGGRWREASDGGRMDVVVPATGERLTDVAKATTADVDVRLALARELGATATVNVKTENVAERLSELTGGRGVDLSFDTTGNPNVARGALDAAAVRGTVLVCGAPPPGTEIPVDIQGILTGKVLRGVMMGDTEPRQLIPVLVALHAEGKLPLERLQRTYALDQIAQAADDMHHGVTVKPVIVH